MNKIGIITATTALLFSLSCLSAFAQTTPGAPVTNVTGTVRQQKQLALQQTRMQNLKTRAQNEITRRVTSLTALNTRLSGIKRLTDAQKSALSTGIQTEITNLNTLNTKISSDTDIQTLRTDVKSIVASYRVYLLYLPEVRIISAADLLLDAQTKLSSMVTKLQARITAAQGKGKDVSSLNTLLTDMQAKLADAQTQAQDAITAVQGLQPTDYPGNKGSLQSARTQLKTARQDLKTARQDAEKIVKGLKTFNKTNGVTPGVNSSQSTIAPTQ